MGNDLIEVSYNKFTNRTDSKMNSPYRICDWNDRYGDGDFGVLNAHLRHVSSPNGDSLLIDILYSGDDWFFLRNGDLIININGVSNINLEPHESYATTEKYIPHFSDVWRTKCVESDYYYLDEDDLKKICDAKTVDIRITGDIRVKEVEANGFISYAQMFYNAIYDQNAYVNEVNKAFERQKAEEKEIQDNIKKEKRATNRTCFIMAIIALAILIGAGYLFYKFFLGGKSSSQTNLYTSEQVQTIINKAYISPDDIFNYNNTGHLKQDFKKILEKKGYIKDSENKYSYFDQNITSNEPIISIELNTYSYTNNSDPTIPNRKNANDAVSSVSINIKDPNLLKQFSNKFKETLTQKGFVDGMGLTSYGNYLEMSHFSLVKIGKHKNKTINYIPTQYANWNGVKISDCILCVGFCEL